MLVITLSKDSSFNGAKRNFLLVIPLGVLAAFFVYVVGWSFFSESQNIDSDIKRYVSNLPEDSIYMPDPNRYKNL